MESLFEVRESPIHGLGIFAIQFIPKHTPLWKGEVGKNVLIITADQYKTLKNSQKPSIWNELEMHAYYEQEIDSLVYNLDNVRFMNHSTTPNAGNPIDLPTLMTAYALRDIQVGEEITINYSDFLCPWEGVDNSF